MIKSDIGRLRYVLLLPSGLVVLLIAWQIISHSGVFPEYFLPSLGEIGSAGVELIKTGGYVGDILASVKRVILAFGLATVFGIPLGLAMGLNVNIAVALEPLVGFVRYLPVAGIIPLSILWLGIGDVQKIAIIFIGTFFQLVPMVMDTVDELPGEFLDTARTLGAGDIELIRNVVAPFLAPRIYGVLRISMGIAWTYLVVAEIVAAAAGIGHVIIEAQRYFRTEYIFVGIGTVGLLGFMFDVFFRVSQGAMFPWYDPND